MVFTGKMTMSRSALCAIVNRNGGSTWNSIEENGEITHLVTTVDSMKNRTNKIKAAELLGIEIVGEEFVHDSVRNGKLVNPIKYRFDKVFSLVDKIFFIDTLFL